MSTDTCVLLSHNLDVTQIANLPTLLNQYFAPYIHQIQIRVDHGYTGTFVDSEDGGWNWQGSEDDDWELQLGKLEDEDLWDWAWYPEQDGSFEDWFKRNQSYGYVSLAGPYGMSLSIGSSALVLRADIRWRHFAVDPIVQVDLRRFIQYLAWFLNADSAIYFPDDIPPGCDIVDGYFTKGWNFEEIVAWLKSQEPPKQSLSETIGVVYVGDTKYIAPQGYYIEKISSTLDAIA